MLKLTAELRDRIESNDDLAGCLNCVWRVLTPHAHGEFEVTFDGRDGLSFIGTVSGGGGAHDVYGSQHAYWAAERLAEATENALLKALTAADAPVVDDD